MYYLTPICCVCSESSKNLRNLNDKDNQQLMQKFQYCTYGIDDLEPSVPLCMCNKCLHNLNVAYEFKKSCATNIARLRNYVTKLVQCKLSTGADVVDKRTVQRGQNDRVVYSDLQVHITRCSSTSNLSFKKFEPNICVVESIKTEVDPVLGESLNINDENMLFETNSAVDTKEKLSLCLSEIIKKEHDITITDSENKPIKNEVLADEENYLNHMVKEISMVQASPVNDPPTSASLQSTAELVLKKKSDLMYKCNKCERRFSRINYLRPHLQSRIPCDKSYCCTVCGKEFSCKKNFKRHFKIHSENRKKYKCTLCPKQYNRSSSLKIHLTEAHQTQCSKCDKMFKSNRDFRLHRIKEHFKEFYFKCEICGKVLTNLNSYQIHVRSHESGTPFQCTHCPEAFQNNHRLKEHMALKHYIGKLMCTNCGINLEKPLLDEHMKTHEGELPHVCSQCGKEFKREKEFRVHVRRHDVENCYKCRHCGKTYLRFLAYKNHMLTHSAT